MYDAIAIVSSARRPRGLAAFVASACLFLVLGAYPAQGQSPHQLEQDFPILSKTYSLAGQRADFIIAIDRSRSMKEVWPLVKAQLLRFVAALPEHDHVSILGFAEDADQLLLPRTLTPDDRNALLEELRQLPAPNEQPKNRGQRTDLIAGANAALEAVNRPGASNLCFVFVFTDFKHQPPAGAVSKSEGMKALAAKYTNYVERTGRLVKTYAIQLPLGPDAGADFDIFLAAFGGKVSRVIVTTSSLAEWFDEVRATFGREKLKALVERDLEAPAALVPVVSNAQASMGWRNTSRLGFSVSGATVSGPDLNFSAAAGFNCAPQRSGSLPVATIARPIWRRFLPRRCVQTSADVNVTVNFEAATELAKLNLPATKALRQQAVATVCEGMPIWVHGLTAALLALLCWGTWRRWLRGKRPFDGRSVNVALFVGRQQVGEPVVVRPSADGSVAVGLDALAEALAEDIRALAARLPVRILLPAVTVRFVGRHPRFPGSLPQRGTYAYVEDGGTGAASRQSYRLKTFAQYADPDADGTMLQAHVSDEDMPVPEHEDLYVHFRHAAENQAPLDYQLWVSPER